MQTIDNQINIEDKETLTKSSINMEKIKIFFKKYWKFVAAILVTIVFLIFISEEKYTLEVTTSHENSIITIDETFTKTSTIKKRLTKGEHVVKITKEGYVSQEKTVNLISDSSIHIILLPILALDSIKTNLNNSIPPDKGVSLNLFDKNTLIGIDPSNGYLITISSGAIKTIHARDVYSYSFDKPYVYVIDRNSKKRLTEINISTNEKRTINLEKLAPIVSASLAPNGVTLAILGNFDLETRNTTLYKTPRDNISLQEITTSIMNEVKYLSDDMILSVEYADANNLSVFSIHDSQTWKKLYSTKGNNYYISPDKGNIIVQRSDFISIINLSNLKMSSISTTESTRIAWSDKDTIVFINNLNPGVKMYYINLKESVKSSTVEIPELSETSIKTFVGIEENIAHLIDSNGKFWNINLPF